MSKPYTSLTPSIDSRISSWAQIQDRMAQAPEVRVRPTITLSRQFGCEGYPLAQRLNELMSEASGESWNVYDKALIDKVAEKDGISLRILNNLGDRSRALETLGLMGAGHTTHDEAFQKIAKYIIQIAGVGNAVIVGRGGAILCKGMQNSFHFRLQASFEFRVASIMKRLDMPQREAEKMVKENSKLRDKFISDCLAADVGDLQYYDAVFNNEHHTVEEIAFAIFGYVKSAWAEKGYFKA